MIDKNENLIPEEDLEYERRLAEEAANQPTEEELEAEAVKVRDEKRKTYEKDLNDRKIELMKLKQGVIEESDIVKEEQTREYKLSFGEWISNVWYRNKWLIIFVAAMIFAFSYIVYDQVTTTKPDLTVLVLSPDYSLYYRTQEMEMFLDDYCDDFNGDGEVYVQVYNISTDYSDPNTVTANQAQIMSQLQSGENIILIADDKTDFAMHDFTGEYPENERFNELGMRLNCQLVRDALKWEAMNDNVYIGMREPTKLLATTEEEMQENFDKARAVFERIVEAVSESEK